MTVHPFPLLLSKPASVRSYWFADGQIHGIGGRVFTEAKARELRAFYLDDAERQARKTRDPELHDWMFSRSIACARELHAAIRQSLPTNSPDASGQREIA